MVRAASIRFPVQSQGFSVQNGALYELVITPVYVQTNAGLGLLNVLVAGFEVDDAVVIGDGSVRVALITLGIASVEIGSRGSRI